jgi:hypothetical protein
VSDEVSDALHRLLRRTGLSLTELGAQLTSASAVQKFGKDGAGLSYDAAAVKKWLDGKQSISRAAAWLLDDLYPADAEGAFQVLRDRYVLASDRAHVPAPGDVATPLVGYARCSADFAAKSVARRPMALRGDETAGWVFLSVVDCEDSRRVLTPFIAQYPGAELLAVYHLLGRWDLAIKLAVTPTMDFASLQTDIRDLLVRAEMTEAPDVPAGGPSTGVSAARTSAFAGQRSVVVREMVDGAGSEAEPQFLLLPTARDYDRLRVQRGVILVDLTTVVPEQRPSVWERLRRDIGAASNACRQTVESITRCEDAIMLELVMTCADHARLNELNQQISEGLTRYKAKKYTLLAFYADETGWLGRADATPTAP